MKIGVIGCGTISGIYLENCTKMFDILDVAAVADMVPEMARKRAEEFGVPKACTVEELLADPEIELVLNLTSPHVHADVNLQILSAGKHVYAEKPFALNREDADRVMALAREKGLRIGSAPDTFLGGGLQTSRKIIDDGWIGTPYSANGLILMGYPWDAIHPNFPSFMKPGWDPLFDMTPYYFTALVFLLGPVSRVAGYTSQVRKVHAVTNPRSRFFGQTFEVEPPMSASAVLEFECGATASMQAAKESFGYTPRLEVYGTEGILYVPDPNAFDGAVRILQRNGEVKEFPYSHGFLGNSRGIGVADMAHAIRSGRPHRASGELARHVLDITLGVMDSSRSGRHVEIEARCERPPALPMGLKYNLLDD